MRVVSYDGVAAVTTDEIAEALMAFALTVARYSSYETVTIPVVVEGEVEQLTLMLGPTIHLSTLTTPVSGVIGIRTTAEVVLELQDRTLALTEPVRHFGLEVEATTDH